MHLSVVLPAHNEAEGIADCLRRLSAQGEHVSQIIVVDNASTDATASLVVDAGTRDERILLVSEPQAGVAHARYTGFAAATGDVIVSIDGDTRVEPGWAEAVATTFSRYSQVTAGTCPMAMFDLPFQGAFRRRIRRLEDRARRSLERGEVTRVPALSGANSAIRRDAWNEIAHAVSYRADLFEDLDRSLLLQDLGHPSVVIPGMTATVSGRRLLSGPRSFFRYAACGPRTYAAHGRTGMVVVAWVANLLVFLRTMALLPVNRAWDPDRQAFSVAQLMRGTGRLRGSPIG